MNYMSSNSALSPEALHLFEALPDLYLILSTDFTILTASKAYLEIAQKNLDEIQGKNVFEVFPDNPANPKADGTTALRKSFESVLANKQVHKMDQQRYDITVNKGNDTFIEKYWRAINTPVLDKAGEVQYILLKVEDITAQALALKSEATSKIQLEQITGEQLVTKQELIKARAQADLERRKLENLFMQAPALICIFEGPEHVFALVNPLYQQLVGDRPILGKPIAEAMPELEGQPIFGLLDKVYQTGETIYAHETQVQLDHTNSGDIGHNYYNFTYQAIRNLEGEIYGIMVFAYEVTTQVNARKEIEKRQQALQELNKKLEEANQQTQAAYSKLAQMQLELQKMNRDLEKLVTERTSELEQSNAAIEEQRNFLHTILMNAPTPFVILEGPEHVFQLVNPSFQQLFPGRNLVGKPLIQALPEIDESPIPRILDKVYLSGETYEAREYPLMLSRHEGEPAEEILFTFTYQAHRNQQGVIDGVLVFAHDVTLEVLARNAVQESAQQLKLITDALPVLIGYLDKEERYRFANKAYESWFPLKAADLLGRKVRDVVGEKAYQGVKQYIDRALAGERLDFESKMPYRDEFVKHIRTSYVPDIREGKVAGFYTLVNDITEQVEIRQQIEEREQEALALSKKLATTNEELSTINDELVRTNVDLDNFIYAASHDLKAPIFNIERLLLILLESIPSETQEAPELSQVLDMISNSIVRFKRTIDHLTDVTKLQKENNQETTIVNMADLIHDVELDLISQIETSGAQVDVNVAECPAIRFSEKNLRSVIYNLLSNAIKYRSPDQPPKIKIDCQEAGEYILLRVQDNGLGLDLAGQQKIFSMFVRLHDHVEGTGVGLYMVKKIVENADGRIEVESAIGAGSTFKVYLKR
jgi:two-component system, sensor histidine kinase